MQRCLSLAKKALGNTYPNPMVGAVIVNNNNIIGEGWHKKAGTPHAEVNAINMVRDQSLLPLSTLYVNLEPCSHTGKTPPCADLIIKHGIKKVVIASKDPNPLVAGKGISKLKEAGVEVIEDVLKEEAEFLNRRFYTFHLKKRPYLILKWAQTQDGFIAPLNKKETAVFWISSSLSKQKVHQWRSEEAGILVGVQTIINDDPYLTTREWPGNNPLRIILDPNNRVTEMAKVLCDDFPTLIANKFLSNRKLKKNKEELLLQPFNLQKLMKECHQKDISSILVEGGQKTLQFFIDQDLWDEARVFTSNKKLIKGIKAPEFLVKQNEETQIRNDSLNIYFRKSF